MANLQPASRPLASPPTASTETALSPSGSPPTSSPPLKGFLTLPAELRLKIYDLALPPSPSTKTPCFTSGFSAECKPLAEHLASTCSIQPTTIRTIRCCSSCKSQGNGANKALLRVNRQVFHEAAEVLYANAQAVVRQKRWIYPAESLVKALELPSFALQHMRSLLVTMKIDSETPTWASNHDEPSPEILLPSLRTIHIHLDVDLFTGPVMMTAKLFPYLHIFAEQVSFVIDIHIFRAWRTEVPGWWECVEDGENWEELVQVARYLRLDFIEDLKKDFAERGKMLRIKEL